MSGIVSSEALCRAYLRSGEELRGPADWTLRPGDAAFVVEIGYPEAGQAFNGFADGWGTTPEEAWNRLGWKLTERQTSGRFKWPRGQDKNPLWPTAEQVEKQIEFYRRSMSPMGFEYAKGFLWEPELAQSMGRHE